MHSSTVHSTKVTVSVYFEGTANSLDSYVTQIGLFAALTDAVDLKICETTTLTGNQYKISFDGCGVTNGLMGTLFATGLHSQCKEVEKHVKNILSLESSSVLSSLKASSTNQKTSNQIKVNLNVVGLSRGGIAAIQLAQMLHYIPVELLQINLLLFDPVPGNLITSSKFIDIFSLNTANSSLDMSYCHNVRDVLALYPFQPLPDISFHAPLLPKYPAQCTVEEDATLGCHQGALFCQRTIDARLSFFRIHEWLVKHGTQLHCIDGPEAKSHDHFSAIGLGARLHMTAKECQKMMDEVMRPPDLGVEGITRYTHSSPPGAVISLNPLSVDDFNKAPGLTVYLNKYHQRLSEQLGNDSTLNKTDRKSVKFLVEVKRPSPNSSSLFSSCTHSND
mmetsp:Transcript_17015/g.28380  ORF Transcript_17015/g.28380 Transcript_17015/m.28380 type:complete len:391 (+) Transcript_17015:83-1255(+)